MIVIHRHRKYEDVECPRCGAEIDEPCRLIHNPAYHTLTYHAARRRASRMR